jgi:hypothetical protein
MSMQILAGSVSPRAARWSIAPALTGTQRPRASGLAQNVHLPWHALSQQTPSTQKPDAHWSPLVQSRPFPMAPQLPPTQVLGATQVLLLVQLLRQAAPSQVDGLQDTGSPRTHTPSPSHRLAGTTWSRPWQAGGRHIVPAV